MILVEMAFMIHSTPRLPLSHGAMKEAATSRLPLNLRGLHCFSVAYFVSQQCLHTDIAPSARAQSSTEVFRIIIHMIFDPQYIPVLDDIDCQATLPVGIRLLCLGFSHASPSHEKAISFSFSRGHAVYLIS